MAITAIEQYLPFNSMCLAYASDGAVWQLHPPTSGGLVQISGTVTATPPTNTTAPVIAAANPPPTHPGTITLTSPGKWTNSPTFTYQWMSGATAISGATHYYYVMQASDVGNNITCVVTGTNMDGSASATSNSVGPVA